MIPFATEPLECPRCGGSNMHHGSVRVYVRREDAERGLLVGVDADVVACPNASMRECPSPRRGGVRVYMDCEHCGHVGSIAIVQHKGCTYIEWETS